MLASRLYPRTHTSEHLDSFSVWGSDSFNYSNEASRPEGQLCGGEELLARSYRLPQRWPFPSIRMVMERTVGTCDLYRDEFFCSEISADMRFDPNYHLREAVTSFLFGCRWKNCTALDIGANHGWLSVYMLALGAQVVAVEPQIDLAKALNDTIRLNCWSQLGEVVAAVVTPRRLNSTMMNVTNLEPYRAGGHPLRDTLPLAPALAMDSLFSSRRIYDLISIDGDGREGQLLQRLSMLIHSGRAYAHTVIIECGYCAPTQLRTFQVKLGYDAYILDVDIDLRRLDAKGIDRLSPEYSPIDERLPSFLEEMYSIRAMRHLYHINRALSHMEWSTLHPQFSWKWKITYLFTKERLLEPRHVNKGCDASNRCMKSGELIRSKDSLSAFYLRRSSTHFLLSKRSPSSPVS